MDCCKYGEYRAPAHAAYGGVGSTWDGYYSPYAPYTPAYYAPAAHAHLHDPYARYYRYDYPAHHPHAEHALHMDYGAYAAKEVRVRRALSRRERPLMPAAQHPHTPTPPLECGVNGRGPAYCEQQMWPHYQMGVHGGGGGWNNVTPAPGMWASRGSCAREQTRYPTDCRPSKVPLSHPPNPACLQDGRSTPFRAYEDSFNGDRRQPMSPAFPVGVPSTEPTRKREQFYPEPKRSPPEEKRPPVVPLPAFQQAFGSTEIGKFAEAFSRAEVAHEDSDNFSYESFHEWDAAPEPQWSSQPSSREIKCEDIY